METTITKPDNNKLVTAICLFISALLIIGWPTSMIISWQSIADNGTRIAYLIGDLSLVSPLFVASWLGLRKSKNWGSLVFLVAAGALSYDVLHFGVFLITIKFLDIPAAVYVLLIVTILAFLFYLVRQRILYVLSIIKN